MKGSNTKKSDITGKLIPPRKLHGTSWGYVYSTETPEGRAVGIVKNHVMNSGNNYLANAIKDSSEELHLKDYIIKFEDFNNYKTNKLDYCYL